MPLWATLSDRLFLRVVGSRSRNVSSRRRRRRAALLLARGAAGQLNLLVVGDWGGASTAPFTTAVQQAVAVSMGAVGAANKITEVFGIGDNFYEDGSE